MYHTIWPEGQAEKAKVFTEYRKARWHLFVEQLKMLRHLPTARRMRWARCEDAAPDPWHVEYRLHYRGAIPPKGGWVLKDIAKYQAIDSHLADCNCEWCWLGVTSSTVHIHTHAVL